MKVLIVDDQRLSRMGIHEMIDWKSLGLTFDGYARNGAEALEHVRKHSPQIIITDVNMPLMSGIELASHLYAEYPQMKVIIVSGYNEFEYVKSALKYKAIDYILKPIKESELNEALSKAILGDRPHIQTLNMSGKYWDYPVHLETKLIHSIHFSDLEKVSGEVEQFFRSFHEAGVHLREARLWIGQLILQVCRSMREHLPEENMKQGFVLSESLQTISTINELKQKTEMYFLTIASTLQQQKNNSYSHTILQVKQYIDEHFHENITVNELSTQLHMSSSQFSNLFKQVVNVNFITYLTELRLSKAKAILAETEMTIDHIALKVGYPDPSYFRRLFKRSSTECFSLTARI